MSFSFPNNPTLYEQSTQNGRVYVWTGSAWEIAANFAAMPSISGGAYVDVDIVNDAYIINATGLQPSGSYSVDGHTHNISDINDFNIGVSGLLPTISNSGNNRLLTSDGTSYGINAENNLTFDNLLLEINCQCPSGNAGLKVIGDNKPATIFIEAHDDDILDKIPRLIFKKTGGSATNPTVPITDATLFSVRGDSIDSSGNNQALSRIRSQIVTPASGVQNSSTSIKFEVSSTSGTLDNSLQLLSDGSLINSGPFSATSGSFTSLNVNGTGVSLNGHTHTSTNITDFNSSVSGLLPITNIVAGSNVTVSTSGTTYTISSSGTGGGGTTITNYSNNRLLTSDGTSTGIVAESGLLFNGEQLIIRPNISGSISGLSPLVIYNDVGYSGLTNQGPQIILNSYASGNNISTSSAARLVFAKFRGTEEAPLPAKSGDCVFVIRGNTLDADNTSTGNVRIRADVVSPPVSGSQPYDSNRLYFNTSDGQNTVNNTLSLENDGEVYTNGYLTIFNQSRHSLVDNNSQQQSLGIYSQPSANIGTSGSLRGSTINFSPVSPTGDYNINYYSTLSNIFSEVRENVTNSGSIVGAQFGAWRNARGSNIPGWYDDNGELSYLFGLVSVYGHTIGQTGILGPAPTGVTPYTENAIGLYIYPQRGYGTINYAYDLFLADDQFQIGNINNHYGIYQASDNPNYFAGSISVDNGLSAPTPVYSLGTVSGNTAINYATDRQIQTMTLAGGSVNFTEGTGWTTANRSVDVVLHITVTSTTTVAFDSGFITDWYSILPAFTPGTYMILIRSIGSTVIQGHYLGKKI